MPRVFNNEPSVPTKSARYSALSSPPRSSSPPGPGLDASPATLDAFEFGFSSDVDSAMALEEAAAALGSPDDSRLQQASPGVMIEVEKEKEKAEREEEKAGKLPEKAAKQTKALSPMPQCMIAAGALEESSETSVSQSSSSSSSSSSSVSTMSTAAAAAAAAATSEPPPPPPRTPFEEATSRHACASDASRILPNDFWATVWKKLRSQGWGWKPAGASRLDLDYYYVMPTGKPLSQGGKLNKDYLEGEAGLKKFATKYLGWIEGQYEREIDEEKAIQEEQKEKERADRKVKSLAVSSSSSSTSATSTATAAAAAAAAAAAPAPAAASLLPDLSTLSPKDRLGVRVSLALHSSGVSSSRPLLPGFVVSAPAGYAVVAFPSVIVDDSNYASLGVGVGAERGVESEGEDLVLSHFVVRDRPAKFCILGGGGGGGGADADADPPAAADVKTLADVASTSRLGAEVFNAETSALGVVVDASAKGWCTVYYPGGSGGGTQVVRERPGALSIVKGRDANLPETLQEILPAKARVGVRVFCKERERVGVVVGVTEEHRPKSNKKGGMAAAALPSTATVYFGGEAGKGHVGVKETAEYALVGFALGKRGKRLDEIGEEDVVGTLVYSPELPEEVGFVVSCESSAGSSSGSVTVRYDKFDHLERAKGDGGGRGKALQAAERVFTCTNKAAFVVVKERSGGAATAAASAASSTGGVVSYDAELRTFIDEAIVDVATEMDVERASAESSSAVAFSTILPFPDFAKARDITVTANLPSISAIPASSATPEQTLPPGESLSSTNGLALHFPRQSAVAGAGAAAAGAAAAQDSSRQLFVSTKMKVNFRGEAAITLDDSSASFSTQLEKSAQAMSIVALEAHLLQTLHSRRQLSADKSYFPTPMRFLMPISSVSDKRGTKSAALEVLLPRQVVVGSVMDLIAAQLSLGSGGLPEPLVARIALEGLKALAATHKRRVIHGDVSARSFVLGESVASKKISVAIVGFGEKGLDLQLELPANAAFDGYPARASAGAGAAAAGADANDVTGALANCNFSNPALLGGENGRKGWIFEPDLFGLADTVHMMLYGGQQLKVIKNAFGKFVPSTTLSNFLQGKLAWDCLFSALLNPKTGVGADAGFHYSEEGEEGARPASWTELEHAVKLLDAVEKRETGEQSSVFLRRLAHRLEDADGGGWVSMRRWLGLVERDNNASNGIAGVPREVNASVLTWSHFSDKHALELAREELQRTEKELRERTAEVAAKEASVSKGAMELEGRVTEHARMLEDARDAVVRVREVDARERELAAKEEEVKKREEFVKERERTFMAKLQALTGFAVGLSFEGGSENANEGASSSSSSSSISSSGGVGGKKRAREDGDDDDDDDDDDENGDNDENNNNNREKRFAVSTPKNGGGRIENDNTPRLLPGGNLFFSITPGSVCGV